MVLTIFIVDYLQYMLLRLDKVHGSIRVKPMEHWTKLSQKSNSATIEVCTPPGVADPDKGALTQNHMKDSLSTFHMNLH